MRAAAFLRRRSRPAFAFWGGLLNRLRILSILVPSVGLECVRENPGATCLEWLWRLARLGVGIRESESVRVSSSEPAPPSSFFYDQHQRRTV